jgi:hypothetical protein
MLNLFFNRVTEYSEEFRLLPWGQQQLGYAFQWDRRDTANGSADIGKSLSEWSESEYSGSASQNSIGQNFKISIGFLYYCF